MKNSIEILNRYIASTEHELRVVTERFHGSRLRAFVLPNHCADFFVNNLLSDYCDADATISFLDEHPLFPAAEGKSLEQVLHRLDGKLAVLYRFETGRHGNLIATPNFIINNAITSGPDTKFEDIVNDLSRFYKDDGWYDWLKNNLSTIEGSHVYHFLKYNYPKGLKERLEEAENKLQEKFLINGTS